MSTFVLAILFTAAAVLSTARAMIALLDQEAAKGLAAIVFGMTALGAACVGWASVQWVEVGAWPFVAGGLVLVVAACALILVLVRPHPARPTPAAAGLGAGRSQ